jgi:hypothetical protein
MLNGREHVRDIGGPNASSSAEYTLINFCVAFQHIKDKRLLLPYHEHNRLHIGFATFLLITYDHLPSISSQLFHRCVSAGYLILLKIMIAISG